MASTQIDVEAFRGPGDRPGETIRDPMVKTVEQAREVVAAVIDQDFYIDNARTLSHAYNPDVLCPGKVITVNAAEAAIIPGTKVYVKGISDQLKVQAKAIDYRATTEVHDYENPPAGFGL